MEGLLVCPIPGCSLACDITLISLDGVRFGAHSDNLVRYGGGFPVSSTISIHDKPVMMHVSTYMVDFIIKFTHSVSIPEYIENLPVDVLLELAWAADRWQIYGAMAATELALS
ncbi:hypothetical protein C8J56DRAFT_7159 [Mycena floridula]|nr:hypothetical protein C8J56DRAFT_7159 [Mycena floridula]